MDIPKDQGGVKPRQSERQTKGDTLDKGESGQEEEGKTVSGEETCGGEAGKGGGREA